MKSIAYFIVSTLVVVFTLASIPDAHAKRFGGGRSFGSKPSYSTPFRGSTSPRSSASQQQAAAQNQGLRNSMARRGGLMGMLGGLALGGLLGSLLFGGAFENINLFDILIFGAIAFMLYKLFAARSRAPSDYANNEGSYSPTQRADFRSGHSDNPRGFDTDLLFNKDRAAKSQESSFEDADFETVSLPSGFDQSAFLEGAKKAYQQLQSAWDRGDLSEIRGLTTDHVFTEIKDQIEQRDASNRTEIIKLEAELLDVRDTGNHTEASVLFDSILRESSEERPAQVREIWHFIRPLHSATPTWYLDGLQQLEN